MTREQLALMRLVLICAAWAVGQTLAAAVAFPLADFLIPAAFAAGVYVVTTDLGRRPADLNARYWRGRRIDDDDRGPRRWN